MRNILNQIREDMAVYDRQGNRIGTVDAIQFGDENPQDPGINTVTAQDPTMRDNSLIDDFARALDTGNDLPDVLRARLLRYGFFKIDTGMLSSDRYVSADQIAGVDGDRIMLNVAEDDLIKA